MPKIAMSSGHGKYIRGAAGPEPWGLDEVDCARDVVNRTAELLGEAGVSVETYHDDVSNDQDENLHRIVDWHNARMRDLDVSIHFNAYEITTTKAMGTECLYVSQEELANDVSAAIAAATGLPDRGPKYRSDLFFLNNTSAPAVLVETVFCDAKPDCDSYRRNFEAICRALAETLSGQAIEPGPRPPRPEPPEPPQPEPPSSSRPTIRRGDTGPHVVTVQTCLHILPIDGDFGPATEEGVIQYQRREQIEADGVVGPTTWAHLEQDYELPPYPPPLPPPMHPKLVEAITGIALRSEIAEYDWNDRGQAPIGYTKGMAIAFAQVLQKWYAGDSAALEMAKANTGDEDHDALAWYEDVFDELGMDNDRAGRTTLRHLFVLLMGLGMRESSGRHCEGRDMSADNVSSETAEAGLFQMSWNASSCSGEMDRLMDQYSGKPPQCALQVFAEDVSCSESDWECYGSGDGFEYQSLAKRCPQFAVETAAIGLRNLRQHWGPINRLECEVRPEADRMLSQVQALISYLHRLQQQRKSAAA